MLLFPAAWPHSSWYTVLSLAPELEFNLILFWMYTSGLILFIAHLKFCWAEWNLEKLNLTAILKSALNLCQCPYCFDLLINDKVVLTTGKKQGMPWPRSSGRAPSQKGCGLNSQSGHILGWEFDAQSGHVREATYRCFSPPPKINKNISPSED